MSTHLHFDTLPGIAGSYVRAAVGRRPGLTPGGTVPRIEASLAPVRPDPALLARYNELCGFSGRDMLPPTYLHVLAVPLHMAMLTHPDFPLATLGLVHVAQRIEQYTPIPVGTAVALHCEVEGHKPARKGVTFDLITEGRVAGELCWRGVTTVLARSDVGRSDPSTASTAAQGPAPVIPKPGTQVTQWRVPENLGRKYAAIAKDRNPIHLHAMAAKMFGFKRAIIHGMWTMAQAIATLESTWPPAPTLFTCEFKRPIFLPSSVDFVHEALADGGRAYAVWRPGTDKLHLHGLIAPLPQPPTTEHDAG